ncbi:MAG: NAD-dependent epimerase/dehydratase family protein [Chthoniobacterales bacterium]|nr:NAD-dependent epimerase/dehydratase family protein [Chthoniobacterales bacterium]
MPNQLVLVTGGARYFGSLLARRLLDNGHQVRVLDISTNHDLPNEVEFHHADNRDLAAVRRACEGVDIIHHNVAQVPLAKNRRLLRKVNIQGTETLLRAASNPAKILPKIFPFAHFLLLHRSTK